MSELKVNTVSANTDPEVTVNDALIVNETLEVTGAVTLSDLTPAGYVVNDASGNIDTVAEIPGGDIGTGIPAENIEDGTVSGEAFMYLGSGGTPSNPLNDYVQDQIDDLQAQINAIGLTYGAPIGSIVMWASNTTMPSGWLECNGVGYLKAGDGTYSALYGVIGDTFGNFNGVGASDSSYFCVPDLRGMFVRGWNHSKVGGDPDVLTRVGRTGVPGFNQGGGDALGTVQYPQNLLHTHPSVFVNVANPDVLRMGVAYTGNWDVSGGATGGDGGSESRPINVYLMYIIKYE